MENNIENEIIQPPRLISCITEGLNTVASHIYLILLPLVFDIFLWLGPHLRIKSLLQPFILDVLKEMPSFTSSEINEMAKWSTEIWRIFLDHFNLVSLIKVFPVGIPSMMVGISPIDTPMGSAQMLEISSGFQVFLLWLTFTILGLFLGSLYFDMISRATSTGNETFSIFSFWDSSLQVIFFTLLCFAIILTSALPTMFLVTLLSLVSQTLGQIVLLFIFIILVWLIMPLIFSIHGVFVTHERLFASIKTSVRLVRNFLPGTGLFILTSLLLYQGLNLLWETAPENSWMALVGVLGHAFISTSMIASSFVYYRKGLSWMEFKLHQAVA